MHSEAATYKMSLKTPWLFLMHLENIFAERGREELTLSAFSL
jgi:hypothetical protein